jgi:hypothetical protein
MSESQASAALSDRFFDVSPYFQGACDRRAVRPGPLPFAADHSLTIDATHRIHLNFRNCFCSAQAARGPSTSLPRLRANNQALQPLHRHSLSRNSPTVPSPSSCSDPSCLPQPTALSHHDASPLQEMSSPRFQPTTAPPRAPVS